jgi:cytochrome c1
MEEIARYIDGTLSDRDVHGREVEFNRIPGSGRDVNGVWSFDYQIKLYGQISLITISVFATDRCPTCHGVRTVNFEQANGWDEPCPKCQDPHP